MKATWDYFNENIDQWSELDIFKAAIDCQHLLYERENAVDEANDLIEDIAVNYQSSHQDYSRSMKCFRATAEFGNSNRAMFNLEKSMKIVIYCIMFNINTFFLPAAIKIIPTIDVSKDYPRKSINLHDIADIEYVPLETNNDVLLDGNCNVFHVSDNYIVAANPKQGDVFIFGRNGKIIHQFNHRGQGPMEHLSVDCLVFDEKNKEVFIRAEKSSSPVFLVYTEDGKYKRTIECPSSETGMTEAYNFDGDHLLVYQQYAIGEDYEKKPYMLLSKNDGKATLLDITLQKRYLPNQVRAIYDSNGLMQGIAITGSDLPVNNRIDGQDFIISDISMDTIFQMKRDKSLAPLLIRTPSVHTTNPKIFLTSVLYTGNFILLNRIKMSNYDNSFLLYNFSNGEIYTVGDRRRLFFNTDLPNELPFRFRKEVIAAPKNTLIYTIEAMDLYDNRNSISGNLRKIASTIDEDDNPVLMIAKFR